MGSLSATKASAIGNTYVKVEETLGGNVSYSVSLNQNGGVASGDRLESNDTVSATYFSGYLANGGVDEFYINGDAEIYTISVSGKATVDSGLKMTLSNNLENVYSGDITISGQNSGGGVRMQYGVTPTGSVNGQGNEFYDSDNSGDRAAGFVYDGGQDTFGMTGQMKEVQAKPQGGTITITRDI